MDKQAIFEEYHDRVLHYILGQVNNYPLAEDLCSEIFLKIYEKADTYNAEKSKLTTWVFSITRNHLIDYYRTRKVYVEVPENLTYETEEPDFDEETLEKLADALKTLNDKSRYLIIAHYYQDKTLKQAAAELNISYSYAKILHQKALLKLKKFLS